MEILIYADVLFATNYLMNLHILYDTAWLLRKKLVFWRISLGTALLSMYGTIVFFPNWSWMGTFLGRIAVSVAVVRILAPGPVTMGELLKRSGIFWMVTIGVGGVVSTVGMYGKTGAAIGALSAGGGIYIETSLGMMLMGICLSYGLMWGIRQVSVRRFALEKCYIPMAFVIEGEWYEIRALLDTGCEARDPLTGEGMLLIPRKILKKMPVASLEIPISTVGGATVIMGAYPDSIVCQDERYEVVGKPLLGILENWEETDAYGGIFNPDILRETKNKKGRLRWVCKDLIS